MKIIISGAGICGLTLAVTAKKAGLVPIVIQKSLNVYSHTFGGGIGLWPPSQMVYEKLGLLQNLKQVSGVMPNPCYTNHKGWKLGKPSSNFHQKYKILCLERQSLSKILFQQCQRLGIEIRTGVNVTDAQSYKDHVNVQLSTGEKISAKVLIGADGINSNVRNIIMRERKLPEIKPTHCGYAYFRAVIDLKSSPEYNPNDKWHKVAFQSWGQEKRFGYVPLKEPKTFWFLAVPLNTDGLTEYIGSYTCSQQQKQWILKQVGHWKSPLEIKKLIQMTPANFILRTDIRKIKGVTEFPWNNRHNNILIVGDAANATAPNIAQGAGLAIESAWDLISMVDFQTGAGIQQFLERRRTRAVTVQDTADWIAKIGQIYEPFSTLRDIFMAIATSLLPKSQQRIFQSAVRYSLGGSNDTPHWIPALNKSFSSPNNLGNVLRQSVGQEQFQKLPKQTKAFRSGLVGKGSGLVSVKSGLIGKLFGLPPPMQDQPFEAYVDVNVDYKTFNATQKWTRIFGAGSDKAIKYSTIHHATPDFDCSSLTGLTLTETIGDKGIRKHIKFGYDINLSAEMARYQSNSLWIRNYRLPIPRVFLPSSEWIEQQTSNGWRFDGKLSFPSILGGFKFFEYKGTFTHELNSEYNSKQVVIAGGSGLIGSAVAKEFHSKGWKVVILSRKAHQISSLPFAKVVQWDPSNSVKKDEKQVQRLADIFNCSDVLINLAGQNPGASRWNSQTKQKIVSSRLQSIEKIFRALRKSQNTHLKYIQASAAGFYGNRDDEILNDQAPQGSTNTFRINTCVQIEKCTFQHHKKAMIARIGHVFGNQEGIFPFIRLSSKLRAKKFDKGGQYIPWIHVQDVASSFYFMATNADKFQGKPTNISSSDHHTYDSLYRTLGKIKNRGCYFTIPSKIISLAMGQMSSVITESQRMNPQRLIQAGFKFKYQKLQEALLSKELL